MAILKKLKLEVSLDPAVPFLAIELKDSGPYRKILFVAILFPITRNPGNGTSRVTHQPMTVR